MLDLILDSLSTGLSPTTSIQNNRLIKNSTLVNTNIEEEICNKKELRVVECGSDMPSKGKVEIQKNISTLYKENLISSDYKRQYRSFDDDVIQTVSTLKNALEENKPEEVQYYIYDKVIGWSKPEHLQKCDDFLRLILEDNFDVETVLCVLMASYPIRKRLSYRSALFELAISKASQNYSILEIKQLFSGLE